MSIQTVICNSVKPDGSVCGQPAIVHNARYEYQTKLYGHHSGQISHQLKASHYDIECPDCGHRVQVERARDDSPA